MSLGKKITLLVLLLACCIGIGCYAAISYSIFPAFKGFEKDAARYSMDRLDRAATAEVRAFSIMNGEYARWNDTYNFALGRQDNYVEENLDIAYWKSMGVDLVLIFDVAGKLIWGSFTSPEYGDAADFEKQLDRPLNPTHPLLQHGVLDDSVSGILRTGGGPMLVASDAILTTYGEGPAAGTFVTARYIDDVLIGSVADLSSANARFLEITDSGAGSLDADEVAELLATNDRIAVERTDTEVVGYRLLRDIMREPAAVFETRVPQTISLVGRDAINNAMVIIAAVTMVFLVVVVVLIRRLVVDPVNHLSQRMQHIRKTGDLESNSMQTQSDEIGALAREFDELTTDLHLAQKELEATRDVAVEASRAKSEFLARMSHEIRTPMNGVLGMTELLKNTQMNVEQQRFANTIYSSAENLLEIINDILDFSKIEAGKLHLDMHDIDLGALVEETVDALASQAHQKGLELINDVAPGVYTSLKGDSVRLRQVLTNLVANAVKFTNHGEVVARATVVHEDDDDVTVRVEVIDTGIGIRPEKQEMIFDSFAQGDGSTTREYGGTGLGLAISKQLVDLMGGELRVESESGVGSKFSFTLRLKRGDKDALPSTLSGARVAGSRILVVDDNATNREILEQQLGGWRAHCDTAGSADQAMECLAAARRDDAMYDLVILDMHMPHVDGIDLARRIRAEHAFDAVKLLVLSSIAMAASEETLQEFRIAGQLTKPIRQGQLYDCLSVILNGDALAPRYSGHAPTSAGLLDGRVLLAEDNPVNQAVALGMLGSIGLDVDVVADGKAAVDAIRGRHFDLILMDCQMPVMDGLTATGDIRRYEGSSGKARTPIVALTANAMTGDRERCLEAGMDEYLGKPFTREQLHAVLSLYLRRPELAVNPESANGVEETAGRSGNGADQSVDRGVLAVLSDLQQPGAPSLVGKVIGIYLDSAPEIKDRLIAAIRSVDRSVVRESAHALKSSSINVGAMRLAELCKRLECMARDNDLSGADALEKDLEAEYPRVVNALQSELAAVAS